MSQFDQYGGGGGYMANSPSSPFGGSPSGRARTEASQSLRALTIAQAIKANQAHSEAPWKVDEIEVGQVTFVAQVVEVKMQAGSYNFTLDDGTGRMDARHWVTQNDQGKDSKWSKITANTYIRVIGSLRTFGKTRYINTNHVRVIKDFHEIYYHALECITVALVVERGAPPDPNGPNKAAVVKQSRDEDVTMSAYTPISSNNAAARSQFSHLPTLPRAIISFILEQTPSHEGVDVSTIAIGVGGSNPDARKISEALETLMDQGHVYTTIDDSHFNVSL